MIASMRRLLAVTALLFAASFAVPAEAQVLCESLRPEMYRECRVGSSGRIRLLMELSDRMCHEDISWGTVSIGVVWVSRNCRATFVVDQPKPQLAMDAPPMKVVCESQKGDRQICPAETRRGVALAQQLSKASCEEGKSWGFDVERGLVWVDHGCRAEFFLGGTNVVPAAAKLDATILCESADGKRHTCKAETSAGVQLVRQLTDDACTYGREWGYDAEGVWVAKGCRAEFAVSAKPRVMVSSLMCESKNGARTHCDGDTRYGVALFRKLSDDKCVLGESWGFDETGVWVDAGCRAQFALGGYRLPPERVPPNAAKITCESVDGERKPCPVDTSRGVGLLHQISEADCVLNRTWGYDLDGIWVASGCRAEFAVVR